MFVTVGSATEESILKLLTVLTSSITPSASSIGTLVLAFTAAVVFAVGFVNVTFTSLNSTSQLVKDLISDLP